MATESRKVRSLPSTAARVEIIDTSSYRNFLRMDSTSFEELLRKVGPKISLQNTVMRDAIPAGERLAVTLRFLATGECHLYI